MWEWYVDASLVECLLDPAEELPAHFPLCSWRHLQAQSQYDGTFTERFHTDNFGLINYAVCKGPILAICEATLCIMSNASSVFSR